MDNINSGQIVKIRNRLWRVDTIFKNELTATSIDSFHNIQRRFYVPFENINIARVDIPDTSKVGELSKQQLFITANKINLIHGSSPLLSLQRSSIIPTNFQLVPVIMALNSARVRLLIADDVGLGKTIEAGLILNELIARQMARKILVVCPANLREQWQETLANFFKLDFKIISSLHKKYLDKELPIGVSPWDYFSRLITSVDYAKTKATQNEILNYDWDMVIFDECHLCARPHQTVYNQSQTMQRWELMKQLSAKTKHLLLLTATPHNGYTDSFASLLDVLEIGATKKADTSYINKEKAMKHVCQRRREDVMKWLREEKSEFNPFPEKNKKEVRIEALNVLEMHVYKGITDYGTQLLKLLKDRSEQNHAQFIILHLLKRVLSSPHALKVSLKNRIDKLESGEHGTEINVIDAEASITESDMFENISYEEANLRLEHTTFADDVAEFEMNSLKGVLETLKKIKPANDSKFNKLIETIKELLVNSPKIIIFTRYKDTLTYLNEALTELFRGVKILSIYGEMNSERRKEIFNEFEKAKSGILIATDCISEGINLQYLCSQIVHYELPWNPNRLEQRNGRVDRFGQPEKFVHIRTLIVDNTLDEDILEKIIEKADRIKAEFGFSPPFFNDENAILKRLLKAGKTPKTRQNKSDLNQLDLFEQFSSKVEDSPDDADEDEVVMNKQLQKIKSESFYGQTGIKLPDVERKLRQTEETVGSCEEIEKFIISGLKMFNCNIDKVSEYTYKIKINDKKLMVQGLPQQIESASFDKNYAARNPGTLLIDIGSPLVTRLVQIIKQQSALDPAHYGKTSYKISGSLKAPSAILKTLVRYVVETSPSTIIEEIMTTGFEMYNKRMLTADEIKAFEEGPPCPGNRIAGEVCEDLKEVFTESDTSKNFWVADLLKNIEKRRLEMVEERKHLIDTLDTDYEYPAWLKGVTNISYASFDILTATVGYPA